MVHWTRDYNENRIFWAGESFRKSYFQCKYNGIPYYTEGHVVIVILNRTGYLSMDHFMVFLGTDFQY